MTANIQVDFALEQEAQAIFSKLGMTVSEAVNDFLRQVIREQKRNADTSDDTERMRALHRLGSAWIEIQKYYPDGLNPEEEQESFYSKENQGHIRAAIARMDAGGGTEHELIDAQ